jgi:hypothetical protein
MFCAPRLVFSGIEGVGSRFLVLCARTCFRPYRGRRVPFICFALPDSYLVVRRASGSVLMFCAPRLIFGGTEGVGSRFYILRARTHFRRCLVRRVPISCFVRPFSFSAVPRTLGPVIMFCSPGLVFGGTEGVVSRLHVLRVRPCFLWYRGRRDSFSAVPRASGPVYMFFTPELIFGGTEDVGYRFRVLRARTQFRRYRGRQVPFSCFALPNSFRRYRGRRVPFSCFVRPDSFSAVPRASGSFSIFCAHRHY